MSALWRAEAAAAAAEGRLDGAGGWRAEDVAIDSRAIAPGALFVALKDARDGHDFIADALAKGAVAAVAERRPPNLAAEAPLLLVGSTQTALERLGIAARARAAEMYAIGVTGSVGKTSTKEMLGHMLRPEGPTHAAVKSFNNHWGVPLTLARTPPETRYGVFEIGMNHAGEIDQLVRQARPHAAIITTVEAVHLEAFESVAGIADAKAEIFVGLAPGGPAILNRDNPHYERLADRAAAVGAEILSFGTTGEAARLISARREGEGVRVEAEIHGAPLVFMLGAPGRHLAMNALAALLAVHAAGVDPARAAARLADWGAAPGRGERVEIRVAGGAAVLIDESYNANPASMRAALDLLAETPPPGSAGRRVAFLTDMLELGPEAEAYHAALAAHPATAKADQIHTAGPLMRALHEALDPARRGAHYETAEALAEAAPGMLQAGDAAMVKGSLGSRAHVVAGRLRRGPG